MQRRQLIAGCVFFMLLHGNFDMIKTSESVKIVATWTHGPHYNNITSSLTVVGSPREQIGSWIGNTWIPPAVWKHYSLQELQDFYSNKSIFMDRGLYGLLRISDHVRNHQQ